MHILEQLLSNELLTNETKVSLQEAFDQMRQEIQATEKASLETEIRTQLTEQFVQERNMLVEALDAKMGSILESELEQLKQSINEFRDLEVEYQTKIVNEKAIMSEQLNADLTALVHIVESFLEERLTQEMSEFKQDIVESRKNDLGRRILEAFGAELAVLADPAKELSSKVVELTNENAQFKAQAEQASAKLEALSKKHSDTLKESKTVKLLSQLTGPKRDVMEQLLKDVTVDKLDEKFQAYLPRLIEQSATTENVLTEGVKPEVNPTNVAIKTGDVKNLSENVQTGNSSALTEAQRNEIRRLAGIDNK